MVSSPDRDDAVERFRDDPNLPLLLGSRVLEYGLNLQFANTLISVGVSYNPARERQREGRLRRIGSPHRTIRHWVVLPDTPQTRSQLETLDRKGTDAAYVLGPSLRGRWQEVSLPVGGPAQRGSHDRSPTLAILFASNSTRRRTSAAFDQRADLCTGATATCTSRGGRPRRTSKPRPGGWAWATVPGHN
ncbi:C-terminal helicase domain-containing protein [Lapillicoccus jejuensis]|uniref:C-terminal helicase domain-containing protein n=1 Tax=Lapillicoccus jejuensis TaxID=402171 RepID=UPI003CCC47DD